MARITVLAGPNGAGKSSIAGQALRQAGGAYFNPDEATRQILATNPGLTEDAANALAWQESVQRLRAAIADNTDYTFETTPGGQTVTGLLLAAAAAGHELVIWYCGLDSPERHLARVAARVAGGGHDIPEAKVRTRYEASRANLVRLMPHVTTLRVYDNSAEADPATGQRPAPELVLEVIGGTLGYPRSTVELATTPPWAKPLVARAFQLDAASPARPEE
ncbi:MAG: AAA family ATPase [Rhodanobacter sp.]